jgi:cytochrome b561
MTNTVQTGSSAYNPVAKALHWAIAVLLAVQFVIGWTMPDVHRGTLPVGEIGWHVTVGVLITLLVAARVIWRLVRPPVATGAQRGWLARAAQATHVLLYLLMVIVPVLGWANANSRDWAVGLAQWLELPRIMPAGSKLGHEFGDIHGALAVVLVVLIGIHLAAGLYHQLVLRDDTLRRMV